METSDVERSGGMMDFFDKWKPRTIIQWTTEGKKLKVSDQKKKIFNAKNIRDAHVNN